MVRILAIDPSAASTGWAFAKTGNKPETGTVRFAAAGASEDKVGAAAIRWLAGMLWEYEPDHVAIEAPIRSSSGAQSNSVFLLNLINSSLRVCVYLKTGQSALLIAPSTARKAMTGHGRFEKGRAKPAVFAKCRELGWVEDDDPFDISDACAVYAAAAMRLDPYFSASFTPLMQKAEA